MLECTVLYVHVSTMNVYVHAAYIRTRSQKSTICLKHVRVTKNRMKETLLFIDKHLNYLNFSFLGTNILLILILVVQLRQKFVFLICPMIYQFITIKASIHQLAMYRPFLTCSLGHIRLFQHLNFLQFKNWVVFSYC